MLTDALATFALVGLAELGDKSQLVCLLLAGRYGAARVTVGAALAFVVLNGVAAAVGGALAAWLAPAVARPLAAVLFAGFGIATLLAADAEEEVEAAPSTGWPVLAVAATLVLAELGDKTQLVVAGLAVARDPVAVWAGATAALTTTSAAAAWLGDRLRARIDPVLVRRGAALGFLAVAVALVAVAP